MLLLRLEKTMIYGTVKISSFIFIYFTVDLNFIRAAVLIIKAVLGSSQDS